MRRTRNQLKAALMRQFEAKVDDVLDWTEAHPNVDLADVQTYLLAVGTELHAAFSSEMERLHEQPVREAPDCEWCGQKKEPRTRLTTCWGDIELERGGYWCSRCGCGMFLSG
jgi:hypothetical protein